MDVPIKTAKRVTTLKVASETKNRLEFLRVYPRESYDEIISKLLHILNLCKSDPERARSTLLVMDKERKRNFAFSTPSRNKPGFDEKVF